MASHVPDRIERSITINASRARVWRAVSDHREVGAWLECVLDGPFIPGATIQVRGLEGGDDSALELWVERVEPESYLSFRWHPGMPDPNRDPGEPTTLVEFHLTEVPGGTELRVVETGFAALTPSRHAAVFRLNEVGWEETTAAMARFVAANP